MKPQPQDVTEVSQTDHVLLGMSAPYLSFLPAMAKSVS